VFDLSRPCIGAHSRGKSGSRLREDYRLSLRLCVRQALELEIGDIVWFHRGSKDGEIVVTKAPEDYQKLMREAKKAKNVKGT
jgi:hypothetical protein